MASRVVLHVGAPKSGTTYLQSILFASVDRLAEHGVLVPGEGVGDYARAARAVRNRTQGRGPAMQTWRSMLAQVRDHDGTAVLSGEWFCLTPADLVPRMLDQLAELGGAEEVHVVHTTRALTAVVPAAWQETVKLGGTQGLGEFAAGLEDDDADRWSWWALQADRVLARWSPPVPAARVHVVTVPPTRTDPQALLRRFAAACGFDPAWCDTEVAQPNESLGVEAAELLRRLSPALTERIDFDAAHWTDRYRWLRRYLGHELLVPAAGSRIAVDPDTAAAVGARSRAMADALHASGYDVIGSLEDLRTPPPEDAGGVTGRRHPGEVTDTDLLDLAVPLVADLLARLRSEVLDVEESTGSYRDLPAGESELERRESR
ncbi:hypothetical protein KLP28_12545 [Nocardioidaceae bacterium]|nr:hypothetical protein KLP28_12545 [Nocardioidaceae bacterium]